MEASGLEQEGDTSEHIDVHASTCIHMPLTVGSPSTDWQEGEARIGSERQDVPTTRMGDE